VHFMMHDRGSFGGALIAIGFLYLWLIHFPLKAGQVWAWWLFVLSGAVGFGSFLTCLGYGYCDTWHAAGTALILPPFGTGLIRCRARLEASRGWRSLIQPGATLGWRSAAGLGRTLLLFVAAGLTAGGLTIMTVGTTVVFVPQDLQYLGVTVADLDAMNPRLVPLIAHDRAGFGGAVFCFGLTMLVTVWRARPSRSLWQTLALAGTVGFATAIGVHPAIGYNDPVHLSPAVTGAIVYAAGLALTARSWLAAQAPEQRCSSVAMRFVRSTAAPSKSSAFPAWSSWKTPAAARPSC
jgi:hypothetical protein